MRRKITLSSGEEYAFDVGRNALILILRNATQNVVFKGDSLTPIELSRSDIVDIKAFRNKRMFLANENAVDITIEFQLSDTPISIREQRMEVEGGVTVTEIATPITVSEVLAPVAIEGTVPVSIEGGVVVEFPADDVLPVSVINLPETQKVIGSVEVSNLPRVQEVRFNEPQSVRVSNFPNVQTVSIDNLPPVLETESKPTSVNALPEIVLNASGRAQIAGNPNRKAVFVQASFDNPSSVLIGGFLSLKAGGTAILPAANALLVTGANGVRIYCAEVV